MIAMSGNWQTVILNQGYLGLCFVIVVWEGG